MKKNLFKKSFWKSLLSMITMVLFLVLATASWEFLILAFGFREINELADGRTQEIYDNFYYRFTKTGNRVDGEWHGPVTHTMEDVNTTLRRKTECNYVHGYLDGDYITTSYDKNGVEIEKNHICYYMGNKVSCTAKKSILINPANSSASSIMYAKYPHFMHLIDIVFDSSRVWVYMDSIENIIVRNEYDVSEFDDYYDEAVDMLEIGVYDSIWILHDRLALLNGLDELKHSQFRKAVIDHHRNPDNSTYSIVENSYPNYLEAVNDEGAGDEDFEVFCNIADSIFGTYSPLDPNDHFFPDSVDIRLYRTMDIIYSNEYNPSESMVTKSAIKNNPELLKKIRKNLKSRGENYSVAVDPDDMAGLVGVLMQKHYNRADKIRLAVREAYLKKGGVIDLPIAVTTWGDTISTTSLNINGHVLEDGGAEITGRGIAWATFYNPTVDDNYIESESGMGEFTVNMEEMESGETYYFRSYAINSAGVAYGNCIEFTAGATGIEDIYNPEIDFTLYPNPASQEINIDFCLDFAKTVEVMLINMQKQIVLHKEYDGLLPGQNQLKIDLSGFKDGIYNCKMSVNNKEINRKFLKISR